MQISPQFSAKVTVTGRSVRDTAMDVYEADYSDTNMDYDDSSQTDNPDSRGYVFGTPSNTGGYYLAQSFRQDLISAGIPEDTITFSQ